MHVRGTYQGMEILDGEFSLRVGVEPSRGWIRVALSEMGGKLPTAVDSESMRQQFNRRKKPNPQVKASWKAGGVDTQTTTSGEFPPGGKNALAGIWGDLVLETFSGISDQASTKVVLKNIFWLEAVIEQKDMGGGGDQFSDGEAIVRIELADERVLWELGGSVFGHRNRTLNDISDSVAGKILEWDPAIEKPTAVKELAAAVTEKDTSRPVLDPRSLFRLKTPYLLAHLITDCLENLPGPPKVALPASGKVLKTTPYNIDWRAATLAKTALEDLLNRYNLVMAPDYNGGFQVYERGESARREGGGILNPFGEIATELWNEKSFPSGSASLQLKPLAIEVVGAPIVEEIACPHWMMVIKDDGIQTGHDQSGFVRKVGRWVKADEYLKDINYSMEAASISLMANFDMHASKVYDDIPIQDKEQKEKVKATLRKHLFKSFMVAPSEATGGTQVLADSGVNGFRNFLPMILKRVGSMSHGLNMPNMAIGRDFTVYCDGWTPERIRSVGTGPFYGNLPLEQVDMDDIAHVDAKAGVITFKEPRGSLAFLDKYVFTGSSGLVQAIIEETYGLWKDNATALAGKLQEQFDSFFYKFNGLGDYTDLTSTVRSAMNEYCRETAKIDIPDAETMAIAKKNISAAGARVVQKYKESVPLPGFLPGQIGNIHNFNLSEFKLVQPRILAIWGWERNFGRSDDYYRYVTGVDTGAPAFPLEVKSLVQFIDITGATNKPVLDVLAKMNAEEYLEKRDKALEGATIKAAGFHPVAPSGVIPEVAWRFSQQDGPEAETEVHVNRYQHGIRGRMAALATWSAFQKPLPKVSR